MRVELGIGLIVAGSLAGLVAGLAIWRRVGLFTAVVILATSGALVGSGAMLVQDEPNGIEWALTLLVLGALAPLHARLVLGPPGAQR
jgi:hypothetical protein